MVNVDIKTLLENQRNFFNTYTTISVKFRIEALKRLKNEIIKNEDKIKEALFLDLGKSGSESYMCEIGMTLSEISYMLKNIKRLTKIKRVKTPLEQFHSTSYQVANPYGNVLILSPWNYPFLLSMSPLVTAIAAGNTAILKPSAYAPNTAKVIKEILDDIFDSSYVHTVLGGREENQNLLKEKFDLIFFTGSSEVGKVVLRNAAEHLTPCILELGGKSPVIVDETANIKLAARRIVFGKILNSGQTCVAPDYIYCSKHIKDRLIENIIIEINKQLGEKPLDNANFPKIINKKHFERIINLINKDKVIYGGEYDEESLKISPTVISDVTVDEAIMQEEIFGPLLPIITYENFSEVIDYLKDKPKPLALYLFTENKKVKDYIVKNIRYGGGCINDTIIHLATTNMGFGGVGESGMGAYHGEIGFKSFSHVKSIVDKKTWLDLITRYQPYSKNKDALVKFLLK